MNRFGSILWMKSFVIHVYSTYLCISIVRKFATDLLISEVYVIYLRGVSITCRDNLFSLFRCLCVAPNLLILFPSSGILFDVKDIWNSCLRRLINSSLCFCYCRDIALWFLKIHYMMVNLSLLLKSLDQLARAVEYTDCTPAEG